MMETQNQGEFEQGRLSEREAVPRIRVWHSGGSGRIPGMKPGLRATASARETQNKGDPEHKTPRTRENQNKENPERGRPSTRETQRRRPSKTDAAPKIKVWKRGGREQERPRTR
jgi:hypothetical protein